MRHSVLEWFSNLPFRFARNVLAALLLLAAWPPHASSRQTASPAGIPTQDLTSTSLEDLMKLDVTSVSRTDQKIAQVAAAIFVISQDDIRNSGATNIPDVLRIVPGLDVAQLNASTWAISARGFNDRFSNKLMVMVDGRAVYTPTFGGVFWDVLDVPLEDIERIEVIRGPGASIWGVDAVNGVIDIITKKAADTQGGLAVAGGGNVDQGFATAQYGGKIGDATSYRAFAKFSNQSQLQAPGGAPGDDSWNNLRGGFRTDTVLSSKDSLTTEGDLYGGVENQQEPLLSSITAPSSQFFHDRFDTVGGFVQAAWNHTFTGGSDTSLSASYDRYSRPDVLDETRGTLNVDFQHHVAWRRHDFVWGLDYRFSSSVTTGTLFVTFIPPDLDTQLFAAFAQDQIALVSDRLYLTVGTKLEHSPYTGFGIMPTVRLAWTPAARHTFWAAISRALRSPAETDNSLRLNLGGTTPPGGTPMLLALLGNADLQNETLLAYEAGYRASLTSRLSIDFAAYYNSYSSLETMEPGTPFPESTPAPPHIVVPMIYENLMYGETAGFEIFAKWQPTSRLTISPGYAFESIHMFLQPSSQDTTSVASTQGNSPANSAQLRAHLALPHRLAWDTSAYLVGRLTDPAIPAYARLDTGLTWQRSDRLSFSVFGQNLLGSHLEFVDPIGSTVSTLMPRSFYGKVTLNF